MVRLRSLVPLSAKHAVRRVLRRPSGNARRYLPRGVSVEEFLRGLTASGVRYAVLRWFDTLPSVGEGEDVDLLVADDDLPLVESRMTPYRPFATAQKVDLYSSGGLPRTNFGGAPYFPAPLAEAVLAEAVLLHGVYRVPSPERHLDSLAYHAVHHKGRASGVPSAAGSGEQPRGRIAETLQRLAGETSTQLDLTLDGLARFLEARGFRPSGSEAEMLSAERRRLYSSPN